MTRFIFFIISCLVKNKFFPFYRVHHFFVESSVGICRWTLFVGMCNYVCLYLLAIYMFRFRTKQWQETTYYSIPDICRSHECHLPYSYFWLVLTTVPWITLLYKAITTETSVIIDLSNLTFTCIFSRFIRTYVILAHLFPVFLKFLHVIESG